MATQLGNSYTARRDEWGALLGWSLLGYILALIVHRVTVKVDAYIDSRATA